MNGTQNTLFGRSLIGDADLDQKILISFIEKKDWKSIASARMTCATIYNMGNVCSEQILGKSLSDRFTENKNNFIKKCIMSCHSNHIDDWKTFCKMQLEACHSVFFAINSTHIFITNLIDRNLNELNDKELEKLQSLLHSIPILIIFSSSMLYSLLDLARKQNDKITSSKIADMIEDLPWSFYKEKINSVSNEKKSIEQIEILIEVSKINNKFKNSLLINAYNLIKQNPTHVSAH